MYFNECPSFASSLTIPSQKVDLATRESIVRSSRSAFLGFATVRRRRTCAAIQPYSGGSSRKDPRHQQWTMQILDEAEVMKTRAHELFMPALSSTMTEGRISQWLKSEGDFVSKGDIVMVVESDKADMDVESFDEGYIATILVPEGGTAPVGSTVALLAETKESIEVVRKCGLDCVISGAGSRHDGTTAVETKHMPDTPMVIPTDQGPSAPVLSSKTSGHRDSASSAPGISKPEFEEIFMPRLSSTMTEGKIVDWLKAEGDAVEQGENVMVVESDKADMDVESFDSGFLAHIALEAGSTAKVGEAVAFMVKGKEDIPKVKAWIESQAVQPREIASESLTQTASDTFESVKEGPSTVAPVINTGRIIASPYAKKTAKESGVDLTRVKGTGPGGRIVHKDVLAAQRASAPPDVVPERPPRKIVATPGAEKAAKKEKIELSTIKGTGNFGRITEADVLRAVGKEVQQKKTTLPATASIQPTGITDISKKVAKQEMPEGAVTMSSLQKAVVKAMNASLSVPVFRESYSINTTAFDELYAKIKSKGVTVSALLAKAVALTLNKHPVMNARYADNAIVYNKDVNIAMALSLPDGGLITPVLKKADSKDLYSVSREWKGLMKKALEKKLTPEDYSSGTFCVSNLGMYGVESFDAIIPPNMGAILAVAASKPKVVVQKNGLIGSQKEMRVTITCDHRHIYGAETAEFLRDLADIIENKVESLLM